MLASGPEPTSANHLTAAPSHGLILAKAGMTPWANVTVNRSNYFVSGTYVDPTRADTAIRTHLRITDGSASFARAVIGRWKPSASIRGTRAA